MSRDPSHWKPYYTDSRSQSVDRQYSLSDRIRYYWNVPDVQRATAALLEDLSRHRIPMTLLSQFLPAQYEAVRDGSLTGDPKALVLEGVARVLRSYAAACAPTAGVNARVTATG